MDKKPRRSLLEEILWIALIALSLLLLISIMSPLFSPSRIWIPAFFGLAYPYLVFLNILFGIVMLFFNRKKALLPLFVLLVGFGPLKHTFKISSQKNSFSEKETDLKILSQNVKLLGIYEKEENHIKDSVIRLVQSEMPGIACFQEFYYRKNKQDENIEQLMEAGMFSNYYVMPYSEVRAGGYFGMIIFSRFSIIRRGSVPNPVHSGKKSFAIWCDIVVNKDTLRVYNVHLQSIGFTETEESLFVEQNKNKRAIEDKSKSTAKKLKRAFINRSLQVDVLAAHIDTCRYPVFLAGDFNDTPVSHTYRHLSSDLNDAFLACGTRGMGKTYNGPFPSFRIDYIFYPDGYEAAEFKIMNHRYSDHFPISCRFRKTE